MLKTISIITFSIFSLSYAPNLSLLRVSNFNNEQEIPITIKHKTIEKTHILIFKNLLSIPENNYGRFFLRMQNVYPVIINIEHIKEGNQIELKFHESLPQPEILDQILQKFSIQDYSLSIYD